MAVRLVNRRRCSFLGCNFPSCKRCIIDLTIYDIFMFVKRLPGQEGILFHASNNIVW